MTNFNPRSDITLATSQIDPENEGFISINASNAKAIDITTFQAIFVVAPQFFVQ